MATQSLPTMATQAPPSKEGGGGLVGEGVGGWGRTDAEGGALDKKGGG